jgi:alpha-D-xyloside xylohydrolase
MPFRPPLIAHEYFVADPPELPRRAHGEPGPRAVTRAELANVGKQGAVFVAHTSAGDRLHATVTSAGLGILRVRLCADPLAASRSARALPLVAPDEQAEAAVSTDDGLVTVTSGSLTAVITLDPWGIRFTSDGKSLLSTDPGVIDISSRLRTLPFGFSLSDGVPVAYHESFQLAADEVLAGTGERFLPLNLRGQRPVMWNFDAFGSESDRAYKNVPFYLSSRGYGLLLDSGMPAEFDFGASTQSAVQIIVPDDVLDYYVLIGPSPPEILDRYNWLTGRPVCPPKWAFGTWISSGFFRDTQQAVLARAATIREHAIPCDVMHLDTYWQADGKWSELAWDPEAFPDPDGMLSQLHAMGFRVSVWMNSYLSVNSARFTEAAEAGYLLTRPDGAVYVADSWHGSFPECGIVDFTNPAATAWFQDLLRPLARQGVDVFKTDFAEGVPADALAFNGMPGTELHNIYSLLFNDAVSEVTREVHGHSMVWARSSYLGGQRHAAQWGGDTMCSYPALASSLNGGLAHGLSGMPYWSHDSGGFCGTPSDELYLRWAQFGALSPLLRFHGTTSREPWRFPAVEAGVIFALRLRYQLLPYLYSAALRSAQTGEPVMRAMMVDSPADGLAWRAEHQYRLGPALLTAPIVTPDQRRDVYLPAGSWVNWWTGETHHGPAMLPFAPAPDRPILLARLNDLIPLAAPAQQIPDGPWQNLTLLSVGGGDGSASLHDDNGTTAVSAHRTAETLAITTTGPATFTSVAILPAAGLTPPTQATLNGAAIALTDLSL